MQGSLPVAENEPGEHGATAAAVVSGAAEISIEGSALASPAVAETPASAGLAETATLALTTANAARTVIAMRTLAL